jgi:hypothetical protein
LAHLQSDAARDLKATGVAALLLVLVSLTVGPAFA